jgi:hypothetical protein
MKRTLLPFLILATAALMNVRAETESIDLKALAKKARPAVMLLVVSDAAGKEIATGTGFLVSSDGKLITNHHVIEDAASAVAKAENGGLFPVEGVLADDPKNDLVLLKLKGKDLPFLPLGNSDKIEVGTRIVVIGSPLGFEGTLSEGIVSAVRELMGDIKLLQVTAAISPGSSGSPVMNASGEVVGVATFLFKGGQSVNFAVSAKAAMDLLTRTRTVTTIRHLSQPETSMDSLIWSSAHAKAIIAGFATDDWPQTLKSAQALVREFPNAALSHCIIAGVYALLKMCDDALAESRQAVKLEPDNYKGWFLLGVCYAACSKFEDAIMPLEQARKLNPSTNDFQFWSLLGSCYEFTG